MKRSVSEQAEQPNSKRQRRSVAQSGLLQGMELAAAEPLSMPLEELRSLVEENGGVYVEEPTSSTMFLVCNDTKAAKARPQWEAALKAFKPVVDDTYITSIISAKEKRLEDEEKEKQTAKAKAVKKKAKAKKMSEQDKLRRKLKKLIKVFAEEEEIDEEELAETISALHDEGLPELEHALTDNRFTTPWEETAHERTAVVLAKYISPQAIGKQDAHGRTVLHRALEVLANAFVNTDMDGFNSLDDSGMLAVAKKLPDEGVLNTLVNGKWSVVEAATIACMPKLLEWLLERVSHETLAHGYPLHYAFESCWTEHLGGNWDCCELLRGKLPDEAWSKVQRHDAKDECGRGTILHAVMRTAHRCIEWDGLATAILQRCPQSAFDYHDEQLPTAALMSFENEFAVARPGVSLQMVQRMSDAAVMATHPETGNTLLHYAVKYAMVDLVRAIVERTPQACAISNKDGAIPVKLVQSLQDAEKKKEILACFEEHSK
eukprot:TRINITY_DN18663_c0_g1_i1.p1 TRINITY_DN18663_c0_g1~~TRINITY_DN18663_c0_g1_i1.p1  ORF type:complete len:489 (+),score=130.06 TRINITY_DN18663_c0_g1_i1:47-1513(+)